MIGKKREKVYMNKILLTMVVLMAAGCAAYVTPSGTYIEPLPEEIVIGPPVVEAPPPGIVVEPLPPVFVVPGRQLYYYRGFYYYNWEGGWYWGREQRGPWHKLPKSYWPSRMERRDRGHGRHPEEREYR
jgi:hypothetical protein